MKANKSNRQRMMAYRLRMPRWWFRMVAIVICLFILPASTLKNPSPGVENTTGYFKEASLEFAHAASGLKPAILLLKNTDTCSILHAREVLKECRLKYKRIECLMEYFFRSSALVFNAPAKYETEEPEMAYVEPVGLQVIEAYLFEPEVEKYRDRLLDQCEVVHSSAKDLQSLVYQFSPGDQEVLESLQLELIRVMTLTITGFDAPLLKSGIEEAYEAISAVAVIANPYLASGTKNAVTVSRLLSEALVCLKNPAGFDAFDRLHFLTACAVPLQQALQALIKEQHLELNSVPALNYDAGSLFARGALNGNAFAKQPLQKSSLASLGKSLFSERALSGNGLVSCASCHQPNRYFTDGLATSIAFDGHSAVDRNAPAVLYAGLQYGQFWDGRAAGLEEQVAQVLVNKSEMNGDPVKMLQPLKEDSLYTRYFKEAFHQDSVKAISIDHIAESIAAYIRTLNPMNADFDRYMAGDHQAMNFEQVKGFNLFMGKAQCGTCHFAPVFNGTLPPYYALTELEVLGITKNDDFVNPVADDDSGRYAVFPIEFNRQAFKTPTIRNAAVTAPYMHHGAFKTLDKVMDFYNKGGGNGLGLQVPNQTLSSRPLQLTTTETACIISFIKALTDRLE